MITRKTLMLTRCVNCGFYVEKTDEFCINCGIESPTREYFYPSENWKKLARITKLKPSTLILSIIIFFLSLFLITDGDLSSIAYLHGYVLFAAFLFAFGGTFLSMFLLHNWALRKLDPKRPKNQNNFTSRKKTIDKRLSELDKRAKTIDSMLSKIDENSSEKLKETRPKLLSAREIVISQFARYELQNQKIELVRLQNGVSPYLFKLHRLNEFETENGLVTIENTRAEINRIRQNLTRHDAIDFPAPVEPEKQSFLSLLAETENSCGQLREALLGRQIARTLQDISPIEENLKLADAKEIMHESEVFNIQTTLTDFSESFEELEREYRRLEAEENQAQKLLT